MQSKENAMLKKWILIFSLVLSLGLIWAQVNIIPVRTDVAGFTDWTDTTVAGSTYLQLLVADANTISPAMNFNDYSAETLDFKARTFGGTNAVENEITVSISTDNGSNWTVLGTRLPLTNSLVNMTQFDLSAYNGTQVKIKFSVAGTNNGIGAGIDDISIKGVATAPVPTLVVNPETLSGFTYLEGSGPSAEQSFTVSGSNLDGNVSLTAPTNYQISLSSGSGFSGTLSINHTGGTVAATTVYVILNAGLSAGLYNGETINITAGTANPASVTLNGSVTAELPDDGYLVNFDGDGEVKASYASGTVSLSGLDWDMTEAVIGNLAGDFFNGIRSARLNGKATSSMTMLADKTGGLGTLSFPYRRYGTDAQVAWKVEYSTDAGTSWTQIGSDFTATADVQTFSETVNVAGNVRIKISLVTDTGTSNKRLNIDDILLSDYAGGSTPTIYASGTFTDFSTFTGTPSESQSYSLSGANLSGNIGITAPAGFQVSVDNVSFAATASVASTFNGLVYVRLSGASVGTFSGNIAHTSTGADAVNLPVSGAVQTPTPTITVTGTLNNFSTTPGTPSTAQSYTVEGVLLTANIGITAPAGFEISLSSGEAYAGTLQLTPASGTVAQTTIYARLTGAAVGSFSGDITHASTGAITQNLAVSGTVAIATVPMASILLRPAQISILDATHESAVLVQVENYPSDDARYRLYNGSNQYYPWDAATSAWITSTSYSSGPQIPGTPSTSVSWWIPFQRGNNANTVASYRDRLGPAYGSNYKTAALPAATAITIAVPILQSQVPFSTWSSYSAKHVVLAYDATETLIAAASTEIGTGAFTILVQEGTSITRIEVRDVMNNLLEAVTGTWPQVLNPQITVSGSLDPLYNIAGMPSEEIGTYTLTGQDLTEDISVAAPQHFELATSTEGPWSGTLSLSPAYNGTVYVRINSSDVGEHSGDITHNSAGAIEATIRAEGETLEPLGEIIVNSIMSDFSQTVGTPSAAQSYALSSTGLSTDISITAGVPFELSTDGSTGWAANIIVASSYNGSIYVRLNSDIVGEFTNVEIIHEATNASPVTITVSGEATAAGGPVDNIFFSEYIEGATGNNKVIEIFNAMAVAVDLGRYQVELYSNGATAPSQTQLLSGTLASGEVYVIANSGSVQAILDQADITSAVCFFNGDDALVLRCLNPDTIIDVFGVVGVDPGTAWDVAGTTGATANQALIRKPTVVMGNTDWASQAGTDANNSEWIVYPDTYYDDLGTHTYTPGALVTAAPVFDPAAGLYASPINVSITSETAGAAIRYTTNGTDPSETLGTLYSVPIAVSENTTIRAIAYAAGYDPSIIIEAIYSFVTPVSDIATLRTQPTGNSYAYTLTGEAILSYQNANRNVKYIQDATAAIVIDDFPGTITTTYNLYDGITGITGYLNLYNGLLQFIPTADPGAATSSDNVLVPEVRTLLSLTAADQAKLIKVMNVTITHPTYTDFPASAQNLTATDATAALTLRTFVNTDYANTPIPADPVNLTCLVGQFGTTMQIGHRFLSDIEATGGALDSPVVTIIKSGNNVQLSWPDVDGASSYRVESSNDPYAGFGFVGTTNDINYSVPASEAKKFFQVIALP